MKIIKTHALTFLLPIFWATAYSEECYLWIGHTNTGDSGTEYFSSESDCVSSKLNMGSKDRYRLDNLLNFFLSFDSVKKYEKFNVHKIGLETLFFNQMFSF